MASTTVTIKPKIDKIREWLQSVVDNPTARGEVLHMAADEIQQRAEVYPQPGPWNFEPGAQGNGKWYVRGYGTRWRRRDGILGGRRTSQKLNRSWRNQVSNDNKQANVYTGVTYAPYLLDPVQRVGWAELHGWQTTDDIADGYADRFQELVLEYIDYQLSKNP